VIDDATLDERLRRTFDTIARSAVIETKDGASSVDAQVRPRRRRRPRVLAVAVAATLVIGVGAVVITVRPDHHVKKPQVAVSPTTSSTAATHNAWCVALTRDQAIAHGIAYGTVIIEGPTAHAKLVSLGELLRAKDNPFVPTDPQTHLTDHKRFWVVQLGPAGRSHGPYTWGIVALDAETGAVVDANEGPDIGPGGVASNPSDTEYWNALPDHGAECERTSQGGDQRTPST